MSQGRRFFQAMGINPPKASTARPSHKPAITAPARRAMERNMDNDTSSVVSSFTPSEANILAADWKAERVHQWLEKQNVPLETNGSQPIKIRRILPEESSVTKFPLSVPLVAFNTDTISSVQLAQSTETLLLTPKGSYDGNAGNMNGPVNTLIMDDVTLKQSAHSSHQGVRKELFPPNDSGQVNEDGRSTSAAGDLITSTPSAESSASEICFAVPSLPSNTDTISSVQLAQSTETLLLTPKGSYDENAGNMNGPVNTLIMDDVTPKQSAHSSHQGVRKELFPPNDSGQVNEDGRSTSAAGDLITSTPSAESSASEICFAVPSLPSNTDTISSVQLAQSTETLLLTPEGSYDEIAGNMNGPGYILIMDDVTPVQSAHSSHQGVRKQLFPLNDSVEVHEDGSISIPLDDLLASTLDDTGSSITPDSDSHPSTQQRKRSSVISDKTPPKKRKVNRENWKSSKAKLANNSGLAHTTLRGKEKKARALKPPCSHSCRKKCRDRVTPEMRDQLFQKYWGLKDKISQWMFLSKLLKVMPIKKRKAIVEDEDDAFRKHTYEYHLCDEDQNLIPVCQPMFLGTFDISISVVKTTLAKHSPDKRGKHKTHRKVLSPLLINGVKDHIKMYPVVPSHYCRADSRKKYLDENLSVAKMYRMYLISREKDAPHTATERQYRDIFNNCFNLGFFHPKKDQCSLCVEFDSTRVKSDRLMTEYNNHQQNKQRVRELKKADKIFSRDIKSENSVRTVTYDLQKILYCPKAEIGEFYYKRKLKCYNFTVFDCTAKQAYNYFWDQTTGMKGSNEITSFVFDYIQTMVKSGVNDFRFYSDSCTGQNKNQFLFSMYYLAAMKFDIKITHRWLVKGHTQMECDSVHARIEKKTKNQQVYTPSEWFGHIAAAKVKQPKYIAKKTTSEDILSFRELGEQFKWSKVPITKLREICVDFKDPGFVSYRTDFGGEITRFKIISPRRGRPMNWSTHKCQQAYPGKLPLKPKLLMDLKWYIKKGFIPTSHVGFYNALFEPALVPAGVIEEDDDDEDDIPQEIEPHVDLNNILEQDDDNGAEVEQDVQGPPNDNVADTDSDG